MLVATLPSLLLLLWSLISSGAYGSPAAASMVSAVVSEALDGGPAAGCDLQVVFEGGTPGEDLSSCILGEEADRPLSLFRWNASSAFPFEANPDCCHVVVLSLGKPSSYVSYFEEANKRLRSNHDFFFIVSFRQKNIFADVSNLTQDYAHLTFAFMDAEDKALFYRRENIYEDKNTFVIFNTWDPTTGFVNGSIRPFHTSPKVDLQGKVIDVAHGILPTMVYLDEEGVVRGSEEKVFQSLAAKLNFKMNFIPSVDGTFGSQDKESGNWTGMIGMIQRGEATFALGNFGLSSSRAGVISYAPITYPIAFQMTFYTGMPAEKPPWLSIFYVFRLELWIAILVSFGFYCATGMKLIRYQSGTSYLVIMRWMFGAIIGNGDYLSPKKHSQWFAMIAWVLTGAVICYAYSSGLIAALTFPAKAKALETFQELVDSDYVILAVRGGFITNYIQTADTSENPLMHRLWGKMGNSSLVQAESDSGTDQRRSEISKPDTAYLEWNDHWELMFEKSGKQVLRQARDRYMSRMAAAPFRKTFPFMEQVDKHILCLNALGLTMQMRRRAWLEYFGAEYVNRIDRSFSAGKPSSSDTSSGPPKLSVRHIQSSLAILVLGLATSTCSFFLEMGLGVWKPRVVLPARQLGA